MNNAMHKIIPVFLLFAQILIGQDYQMRMSGFNAMSNSSTYSEGWWDDGVHIRGSLGAPVISESTGAGVGLTSGFWVVTQGFYTQPPIVEHFIIMDDELNVGEGVNLSAKFSDFNGILNAKIFVNIGGADSVLSFPMERTDSTFTAFIPDSLVKIENFIVSAEVVDSLSYAARSGYLTAPVRFGEDVPTSRVDDSAYPLGIPDEKWRLVSFPGELENGTLTSKGLSEKHIFYSRDWESNEWFVPDTLYLGEAYWFKHIYDKDIDFTPGAGVSLALESYDMELFPGWNFIGNPFFVSVPIALDQGDFNGPYSYGMDDKDGWSEVVSEMQPWGGYLIYNNTDTLQTIELKPTSLVEANSDTAFSLNQNRQISKLPPRVAMNSWRLRISADSENYFDHNNYIGRDFRSTEGLDRGDIYEPPMIDGHLAVGLSPESDGGYYHTTDIRSVNETNGVWDLRVLAGKKDGPVDVQFHSVKEPPENIVVALVDLQTRTPYRDIMETGIAIAEKSTVGYDMKVVIGGSDFVDNEIQRILDGMPTQYSLGYNYPNPFNANTRLDYSLPVRSHVSIRLYNMLGQEVAVLVNEEQPYGNRYVVWDGLNKQGSVVASGVYLAEFRAGSFLATRKMILMK
jgi:hypothetical protein